MEDSQASGMREHAANENQRPSSIAASILKTPLTGVDSSTSVTLTFDKLQAQVLDLSDIYLLLHYCLGNFVL